jgi:hypothetical protein
MANWTKRMLRVAREGLLLMAIAVAGACQNSTLKVSLPAAVKHAAELANTSRSDVAEVRSGLTGGAHALEGLYKTSVAPRDDLERVEKALQRARDSVQDLRVAKSTFFALVDSDGAILRSDRTPDVMAGKNLWSAVPSAQPVMQGQYIETKGVLAEAAGVKGRPDGQWFALAPIKVENVVKGAYLTGWSWSAYAYRLETALRNELKTQAREHNSKEPLSYVYVIVSDKAFGAPVSPEVNATAILNAASNVHLSGDQSWSKLIEITGRDFALAIHAAPELGPDVSVAVLRSET